MDPMLPDGGSLFDRKGHLAPSAIAGYFLDDLPGDDRRAVEAHLKSCTVCAAGIAVMKDRLSHFPEEEWSRDRAEFLERLRQALEDALRISPPEPG